jgi:hypothetical protein
MNATFVPVPGLTVTFDVPQNAEVYLATDGALSTTSLSVTGFSAVDIAFSIDGSDPAIIDNAGIRRVVAANTSGVARMAAPWSLGKALALTAGTHTVQVWTRLFAGSAAMVSGANGTVLQGQVTAIIVKK